MDPYNFIDSDSSNGEFDGFNSNDVATAQRNILIQQQQQISSDSGDSSDSDFENDTDSENRNHTEQTRVWLTQHYMYICNCIGRVDSKI